MRYTFLLPTFSMLFILACKKNSQIQSPEDEYMIIKAKTFFEKNYMDARSDSVQSDRIDIAVSPRFSTPRKVDWNNAKILSENGQEVVLVPVLYQKDFPVASSFSSRYYYSISTLTKLCIFLDPHGQFQARLLTYFPDTNYSKGSFTGIVFEEGWAGSPIAKYKFDSGKSPCKEVLADSSLKNSETKINSSPEPTIITIFQQCSTIYGYNYSEADPGVVYYWSEPAGCTYSLDGGSVYSGELSGSTIGAIGTTGGWNGISPASTILVRGGNNLIGNIIDYNKCFTNVAGNDHNYSVTICVDQPIPGTRQPWGITTNATAGSSAGSNPVNVGHCFMIFSESNGSSIVKRNVGYYPTGFVSPFQPSEAGELNNDDQHSFNISLSITLTNSQFFSMLSFISQNNNDLYNLNSFNCTTFVLRTLYAGDVILPATIGQWAGGSGNDPGDLGEDFRIMKLGPNMSLSTTFNPHPNLGTCN